MRAPALLKAKPRGGPADGARTRIGGQAMTRQQRGWRVTLVWVLAAFAWTANPASAQVFTGRIDVTVQDGTGAVLPGVTVEVSGPQNESTATDPQGDAHFLNLPPGT